MKALFLKEFSVVKGWPDTVAALRRWRASNWSIVLSWMALSFSIACGMLLAIWLVSMRVPLDLGGSATSGVGVAGEDIMFVVYANSLVLALHASACFAGYITHVALPQSSARWPVLRGINRVFGSIAMVFVPLATLFSISVQSWILGYRSAYLAFGEDVTRGWMVVSVLPHALIELTAVFLPLAAWLLAGFRKRWNELIAATMLSTAIAIPMIFGAAVAEVHLWPKTISKVQSIQVSQKWDQLFIVTDQTGQAIRGAVEMRDFIGKDSYLTIAAARKAAAKDKSLRKYKAVAIVKTKSKYILRNVEMVLVFAGADWDGLQPHDLWAQHVPFELEFLTNYQPAAFDDSHYKRQFEEMVDGKKRITFGAIAKRMYRNKNMPQTAPDVLTPQVFST